MASVNIKNPYPGHEKGYARPFEVTDSEFFFGRDEELELIKEKLRQNRFTALLSAPGVGATSLLQAGLQGSLKNEPFRAKNGSRWNAAFLTPTDTPIRSLARALSRPGILFNRKVKPDFEDKIYRQLSRSENGLIHVCEEAEVRRTANILLLVDNFEEIFNENIEHKERDLFYNLLLNAAESTGIALYVIIAMKLTDVHHSNCRNYPLLLRAVRRSQHQLYLPEEADLEEAVVKPAAKLGITVSPEVSENLVTDLHLKDDALSELQRIMHQVWFEFLGDNTKKDKKLINLKYYYRVSGNKPRASVRRKGEKRPVIKEKTESGIREEAVQTTAAAGSTASSNSLYERAETTFTQLSAAEQAIGENMFKVLTEAKDGKLTARSLAPETLELVLSEDIKNIKSVADKFSFILKIKSDAIVLNDSHLITNWSRLHTWAKEEQQHAAFFLDLSKAAIRHYIDGEPIEGIWDKEKFGEAVAWKQAFQPNEYRSGLYGDQHDLAMDFYTKGLEEYGIKETTAKKAAPKTSSSPPPAASGAPARAKIRIGGGKKAGETAPPKKKLTIKKK